MMLAGSLANIPVTRAGTNIIPPGVANGNCVIYLPEKNNDGKPNFGDGTEYPVAKRITDNWKMYCRPAKFLLRKGSFFKYYKKNQGQLFQIKFGPDIGMFRTSGSQTAMHRYQLACPMGAAVSRQKTDAVGAEPPNYRISIGFGFNPRIAIPDKYKGIPIDVVPETYLSVFAAGAYYLDAIGGASIGSIRTGTGACFPLERYAKIGFAKIEMLDETRQQDSKSGLTWEFPIYRDTWIEDGGPEDCVSPDGSNYQSREVEILGAFFGWDTTERVAQVTLGMQEELTDDGTKDAGPILIG